MIKGLRSRLDRLERHVAPQRIICVLDTPDNRQLVAEGLVPIDALPGQPGEAKGSCRRLRKSDLVVYLMEVETGL